MNIGIIGGGIIGLGIGWQLVRRGQDVTLFERDTIGEGASRAAAGMLAPYAEVGFEEVPLMEFSRKSLHLYPQLLDELSEQVEEAPVFDQCGTMMAGIDRDDTEYLKRLYDFRRELNLSVELLTGTEAREREPLLSPNVVSALWLPEDAQVDNRKLLHKMKEAFEGAGGVLKEHTAVRKVQVDGSMITGLRTGKEAFEFDNVVLAAGCWSQQIGGIPGPIRPPVRPVKGQIITLEKTDDCPLKGTVRSPRMYMVPKEDGTIRLGATSEEKGFDTRPTAGGQKELLEHGWEMVPSIFDLPFVEVMAGLRPASRDHRPVLGESDINGLYYATGHYRHGILMAPVTIYAMVEEILNEDGSELLNPFRPQRFNN
ncbi:glycine oxidase ThiO [Fodinibius sediminis]|uniref:Glycine oxidase n=1 Tax=Fodinibius sediminis TaxID=1214077 RepID=A0A521AIK8_9BACT|nr:glycine oxidase ThiO [Fodinibius sediminis]SMO34674.1 glycine oxidase [Fodinibius sediminis]